ncbi:MAG: radical SAM protein [Kiritimatiellia bacterium]|nr:radical SAM protein [Kiritimatiellia bacterium]
METIDFNDALSHCELCPRQCGVNRLSGQAGFCRSGKEAEVYRYAPHFGEEPSLSGRRGSGTVFFSRCTLHCFYCQNYRWSQEGVGTKISIENLAAILRELKLRGCHNWNLVSPTPWLPMISGALKNVRMAGCSLPVVYNTSGYERVETLRVLEDIVDVYLTDLRYSRQATAADCSGAGDYVKNSRLALAEMWRQSGPLKTAPDGIAVSGVICRILILPGLADEACENIRWLADNIGTDIAVSIMAQYTPAYKAGKLTKWDRMISYDEYRQVCRAVESEGFADGWIQDYNPGKPELAGFNMPALEPECVPA